MTILFANSSRDAINNGLVASWGANPKLRLFSGNIPANTAVALSGQIMLWQATMSPGVSAGGVINIIGVPITSVGTVEAGVGQDASFYRIYDSAGVVPFEQGTVTDPNGNGDFILDNVSIAYNQTLTVPTFTKTAPGGEDNLT